MRTIGEPMKLFINLIISLVATVGLATTAAAESDTYSIKFKKGQRLAVIAPKLRVDGQDAQNQYFQSVFPLANKEGFKLEMSWVNPETQSGEFYPDVISLYSWPSAEAEQRFESNPEWPALKQTRSEAWEELKIMSFTLKRSYKLKVNPSKTYTIFFGKISDFEAYDNYLKAVKPILKQAKGRIALKAEVETYEYLSDGPRGPEVVVITEWQEPDGPDRYINQYFNQVRDKFYEGIEDFEWFRASVNVDHLLAQK